MNLCIECLNLRGFITPIKLKKIHEIKIINSSKHLRIKNVVIK